MTETLNAPHVLEYPYKRSVGPVVGRFLAGLRDARILGARTATGVVLVPPTEYDADGREIVGDLVEVATEGVVTSWAWVSEPRPNNPLDHAFAWALITLDGADTALLHAVDAGGIDVMRSGMRVVARWRDERVGAITDIECFVPDA